MKKTLIDALNTMETPKDRKAAMKMFAEYIRNKLHSCRYFDGAVTAHQFIALFNFTADFVGLLREASKNSVVEFFIRDVWGNQTVKSKKAKGESYIANGLWLRLYLRLPIDVKFPRKLTKEAGNKHEVDKLRIDSVGHGNWYVKAYVHRRSMDDRLAEASERMGTVDWRPTETIPEDYYAM